ncbi:hypothetical protein B0H14DRAFT_2646872, partial [Mycena olivaceomarginata]
LSGKANWSYNSSTADIRAALSIIHDFAHEDLTALAPDSGAYMNEADVYILGNELRTAARCQDEIRPAWTVGLLEMRYIVDFGFLNRTELNGGLQWAGKALRSFRVILTSVGFGAFTCKPVTGASTPSPQRPSTKNTLVCTGNFSERLLLQLHCGIHWLNISIFSPKYADNSDNHFLSAKKKIEQQFAGDVLFSPALRLMKVAQSSRSEMFGMETIMNGNDSPWPIFLRAAKYIIKFILRSYPSSLQLEHPHVVPKIPVVSLPTAPTNVAQKPPRTEKARKRVNGRLRGPVCGLTRAAPDAPSEVEPTRPTRIYGTYFCKIRDGYDESGRGCQRCQQEQTRPMAHSLGTPTAVEAENAPNSEFLALQLPDILDGHQKISTQTDEWFSSEPPNCDSIPTLWSSFIPALSFIRELENDYPQKWMNGAILSFEPPQKIQL